MLRVDKSDHWEPPLAFHQLQLGLSATQVVNWLNQLFQMADNKLSTWLLLSPTFHIGTHRSSGPRRSPSEGRKSFTTSERAKVDLAFVNVKKSFSFSQKIILVLKFWLSNRQSMFKSIILDPDIDISWLVFEIFIFNPLSLSLSLC